MSARRYEGLFLIDNNRANQAWDETVAHIAGIIGKHGGEVVKEIKWEERKLAYEIKGHRRGTYVMEYFDIDPQAVSELRRDLQLSDQLLRYAIVRLEGKMLDGPGDLYADGAASQPTPSLEGSGDGSPSPAPIAPAPALISQAGEAPPPAPAPAPAPAADVAVAETPAAEEPAPAPETDGAENEGGEEKDGGEEATTE